MSYKKDKKRVKVIIGPLFREFGGISRHILAIKEYSRNQIVLIPSEFTRGLLGEKYRRIRLYQRVMNVIGLNRFDILHSHVDPWFIDLCMKSRNKGKWVHTYHTIYFDEAEPYGLKLWQLEINKSLIEKASKADVKISVSEWLHDYLQEKYKIETIVIPNGFDSDKCKKSNAKRFFQKYGLKDFVLFIGYTEPPVKNPKLFIELATKMPEQNFLMIGRGFSRETVLEKYGIKPSENLKFLGDLPHIDTLDAISACKIFVMTSKSEGIPTALLEAMSMAKPVVVPDHTGCKEVVGSNDCGFLYTPNSLEELIINTRKASDAKNIGIKARERVYEKYEWGVIAKKIDDLYESIMDS
jgi:glycosyltransferase involved in cell wall biosynthesis